MKTEPKWAKKGKRGLLTSQYVYYQLFKKEHHSVEANEMINQWVSVGDPDFDGDYLCVIEYLQECGNTLIYQRVVENKMNEWVVKGNQRVIKWMPLPPIK